METVLAVGLVAVALLGLFAYSVWSAYGTERERRRVAEEVEFANSRIRQISRAAMRQMLDTARKAQAGS